MVWVRLDDTFADDPVLDVAGADAAWLHVAGLCYSNRQLTDGFVPEGKVRRLTSVRDPDTAAAQLVQLGVWQLAPGGYLIVHHLDRQPRAEDVKRKRKLATERQARWRGRTVDASTGASRDALVTPTPARPVKTGRTRARATDPPTPAPARRPRCIAPDCHDGWIGDDEHGRPIPCPTCRPAARRKSA
jgi:hypothetical protein